MEGPLLKPGELEKYSKQSEIIAETAEQVIKDFARFGMEITFSGNVNLAYEELFRQLVEHIARLLQNDASRLQALLYQIDLSDRDITRFEPSDPGFGPAEHLSDLILQRELKKVVTRDYFRKAGKASGG